MKLFALTVLLSSFLIFNQVGVIDEAAIQNLSVVTQLAKNVQVGGDGGEIAQHMPQFLWLLRDFTLELGVNEETGEPVTTQEYLENCLKEQESLSQKVKEKNRLRALIKTYFQVRFSDS